MTSSSSSSSSIFPFLALPLEIRSEIYALLLLLPPYNRFHHDPIHIHAPILLANRQLHAEASPYLYAHNLFLAHPTLLASFPRLRDWYGPVREPAVVPRIRRFHVNLRLDCDVPYNRTQVAAAFSGLDELSVDVIQSVYLGVGHQNLTLFEGVRRVRRAFVFGSTTGFEDYVKWLQHVMQSDLDADADADADTEAEAEKAKPESDAVISLLHIVH